MGGKYVKVAIKHFILKVYGFEAGKMDKFDKGQIVMLDVSEHVQWSVSIKSPSATKCDRRLAHVISSKR